VPQVASGERELALQTAPRARRLSARALAPPPAAPSMRLAEPPPPTYFDDSPDAIVRFDQARRVVYANAALERATALSRFAFVGRRLGDVEGFADYAPLWEAQLAAVLDDFEDRSFKFVVAHPLGRKVFDVRLALERARDDSGPHVTAVLRDVTVSRHALRASREADEFAETILSSARIGIVVLDRELRVRQWNEYMEQMLGVPAEDVLGREPAAAFDAAQAPESLRAFEQMKSGAERGTRQFELPIRRRDGSRLWARARGTPMFDARAQFTGVFVTLERIEHERFGETSLAALRQALDSAGEIVLEIRRDGTIVDANETAASWLGYRRELLKGMALASIDASLTPARHADIVALLERAGAYHGEARYRTRSGSEFAVDVVFQRVELGEREFIFLLVRDISERKRIEAEQLDAATRFRTIFEESPIPHLLLDSHFRIVQANRAVAALLGFPVQQLLGSDPAALFHPDDAAAATDARELLRAGAVAATESERRLRHRDGHTLWVKLAVRAWSSAVTGRHYLLVLQDFTERKHSEEQLQVLLADQQTLLETMSVGVAQSQDGQIVLANREFAQMFGYADDEVIGMPLWDLARDRLDRLPHEVSGLPAVRPFQTTSAEVVLFRKDGEPVWCLVQARAVSGDETRLLTVVPRPAEAIYTFQDISEIKRQREALSRSLLELNVVLDTTPMAVLHLADGRIARGNAQAYQMFGSEREGLIGRAFDALYASETEFAALQRRIDEALARGEQCAFEAQLRGRDGSFWALVTLRAVDGGNGAQIGSHGVRRTGTQIVSVLDISTRRAQEEQLQTLLAESQLIFDTALVGLLFVRDGRPVRANAAMEELLACEPGALVNQMQLFAHPTDQLLAASLAEHYAQINDRGACEFELHMFRRKGEPIWVAVQGRAVNAERPELGYIFAFVDIDERKRQEAQLRTTLNELQLIFDTALVSMLFVANELIVKANAATERMFGYAAADFSELQMEALFVDPGDWHEIRAQAANGAAVGAAVGGSVEGRGVQFERLLRRADGTTFWCAGNARPIDASAPAQGMIVALMDVDLRRRSEDELRRVRNLLDLVVENLPVLVSVREADTGRFVSLNRAGETITGLPRERVVGRTWHEIYGRQFADLYAELDRKALSSGQQVDRPRDVLLRADGRALTVNQRIVPLYEGGPEEAAAGERARYVMSIIDDLTEEVRAEALLVETETRFRQFAENIDQLVFIATSDLSAILYVNPRYVQLVGAPTDELLENPRSALKHVSFDDAPRVARALPRLIARVRRLRKAEITARIDHPTRGVRAIQLRLSPARMQDGTVRVFGIAEDVTERAAAEQQRIDEAIKQRDILVREVHHRIKNNLQGVAGLLQHMAGAKPEVADTLNEIAGQIQAIAQVHGLQIRAAGTLPVLGVVQGIFTNLGNMFGVEVRFDPPSPALWRWGLPENEAVPLALVINELGTNAIKYRHGREQPISVRIVTKADGIELQLENPGKLKLDFDLARIASGVSGLGLVKALLPRRGARLAIEQLPNAVLTRLELMPPAIGEDKG
jgi:PAS domain S-box-containing protein